MITHAFEFRAFIVPSPTDERTTDEMTDGRTDGPNDRPSDRPNDRLNDRPNDTYFFPAREAELRSFISRMVCVLAYNLGDL